MVCAERQLPVLVLLLVSCGWSLCLHSANAPLPNGAPSDPWSLDGAWKVTSVTRARWSLNGLWGFRPALTNDVPDVVPGPEDNWGWGKIPSVWDTGDTKTGKAQDVWMSEWCIKHGVSPFSRDRAWYRRDFTMPSEADGKRIVLTFTMLQTRAVVYVDGARAGEVTFPGGEVDITDFAKPGRKQSIVLDVTAYWPDSKMVDFSTPHSGGLVQRKGVSGDVYLDICPKARLRIADAAVESDVSGSKVTIVADIDVAGVGSPTPSSVCLVAKISDTSNNPVCEFTSGELVPNTDGRMEFTAEWNDVRRWDTHTPGNRYVCRLEMHDLDGRMMDALLPFEFGFRDVKIAGRDLLLNGVPIHLRSNIVRTMNASAGSACKASALALCRRLKDRGYNHVITCNYSFNPGEASYMDAFLEACDESGVLVSFSLPNVRDFGFNLDDSETEARYRALTRWVIRRARNHPSVITWTMSHNTMGYAGNMNPLRIDGIYELKDSPHHPLRKRHQAEHAAHVARSLDKTRPIYHHESGNLDDFHTANIYLNWAPIQERSDWLQHWSESGVKPCFFVEWGMPHKASWSSYRGPQFIWGRPVYQSLWASEFAAMFRGDAAYEGDTPEVVTALRSEENLWAGGEPFFMWPLLPSLHALTNNYYGIQARYMSDNWRCHRAWGVTAMLPWDMMPWGESKEMRENPARWQNLKAPGIVPDYIGVSGWDTAFSDESCGTTTAVEESLARWNGEDCAFIGGGGVFTDKRHHFRPGEKVKKTLVILNDRRVPQDVAWTCELTGCGSLKGVVAVPPGERRDVPVAFALPTKAGSFEMSATFSFADGKVQRDVFLVESYEPVEGTAVKDLLLFDPRGMTAKQFDRLGIAYERADGAAIRQSIERQTSGRPPMVIGRTCLTREVFDEFVIPTAKAGGRVLVFEQDKAALESVGFRVQSYGLRDVFPRFRDSDLNLPLNESMLRDWNGEATLLPPYLEGVPETEVGFNTDTWAGFRNTRVWRCRNRGNVASVIPEKPTIGDWRALVDGGFDLQYAPLLDWTIGGGRITFCQLDVTARTVDDPVADDLVRCLVSRLGNGSPINAVRPYAFGQKAWMLARDLGTEFMQTYYGADSWQSCVYVVSSGAHKPKWFDAKIASGGRALCLGLTAKEVAEWCPVPLVMATTNGCYAARIDAPPCELNGLSNADWSWHGAMSFDGFTEPADDGNQAIRVVRHGKGYFVFWQVPPWKIDEVAKPYLRTTKRRAQYMLCRILSNMGCNFGLPAIRYADVPIAEDDPYRYYRW